MMSVGPETSLVSSSFSGGQTEAPWSDIAVIVNLRNILPGSIRVLLVSGGLPGS